MNFGIDLRNKKTLIILIVVILLIATVATVIIAVLVKNKQYGETVNSILVSSKPEKSHYYVGEKADYSGLVIELLKNNGSTEFVEYNDENKSLFTFVGFDSSKAIEHQTITVTYGDFTCMFYISVKEVPKPTPVLSSIRMAIVPKTEYKVGEWLDVEGGIILREYTDGTLEPIPLIFDNVLDSWQEAFAAGPGTYTLTVKLKENGVIKTTTYDITITE